VAFRLKDQIKEPEASDTAAFDQLGSVQVSVAMPSHLMVMTTYYCGIGGACLLSLWPYQSAMRRDGFANYTFDEFGMEKGTNQSRAFATIYAINLPPWLPREVSG